MIEPPFSLKNSFDLIHREQEAKRREVERKEIERREAERRKVKKQALLNNLKEQFEQNFLNAHNFYQTQCSKHISFDEYQAEKSNYVRSWIKRHLKPKDLPDPEQTVRLVRLKGMCK